MTDKEELIAITILDRQYNIKCPPDQAADLKISAKYVTEQMRKLGASSKPQALDSIAVVAALNISHELLHLKTEKSELIDSMNQRIKALQKKIDSFLSVTDEVAV